MKGRTALLPLALLAAFLSGCRQDLPRSFSLLADVQEKRIHVGGQEAEPVPGLSFRRPPETRVLTVDHERRPVVLAPVGTWTWRGRVPEDGALHGGVQILPEGWGIVKGFQARIVLRDGDRSEVIDALRMAGGPEAPKEARWLDFGADLSRYAGREVTLEFTATIDGLPPEHRDSNVVAWGPVRLDGAGMGREKKVGERPNILFVLVDTLRFDHTTPYGYERPTTPSLQRLLAGPGLVAEEAYSQAPWTLPSVTSLVTGRYPGEMLGDNFAAYGVPAGVKTLAERLAAAGYRTGGFYANGTLHDGNGFDRGFETFFSPPVEVQPDAAEMNGRVLTWLGAHRRGPAPFFLYVHYIDPHDPYLNPDLVDDRSPFFPEYQGKVLGGWIHGIYNGRIELEDPENDIAHIQALYDSEIRYLDRFLGQLLEAIPADVLEDTLIVLTADHGEELFDHGGWKHGFTLYEEQVHVPLIFRWDGRIPAGRRLPGTVRLLDLAPTLAAAAGAEPDPAWQGIDLLPALTGKAALPRLPAFSQHMMIGPLRASVVLDRRKLILFNPRTPFAPNDPLQSHLWTLDLARLQRVELYDLSRDRKEKQNRAGAAPQEVRRLEPLIHRQLDRQRPGLRVVASGLPAGARLQGTVVFDRPPSGWSSYFLAETDQVELRGAELRFDLGAEVIDKGILVEGDGVGVTLLQTSLDGAPVAVQTGPGSPYVGGAVGSRALASARWPAPPAGPALRVWRSPTAEESKTRNDKESAETEQRLRALGYIQ